LKAQQIIPDFSTHTTFEFRFPFQSLTKGMSGYGTDMGGIVISRASQSADKFEPTEPTLDRDFNNRLSKSKAELISQISSFRDLSKGWNSYSAEPPNETAVNNSLTALDALINYSVFPTKISPSADEGIIFEFLSKTNYYLLEFCNDGDMVYLKRINGKTEAFDISINDIESKINEIKL